MEEPELHQHPSNLCVCARAIVESVRTGNQVVLATHSLELLDYLLAELDDDERADAAMLSVIRTKLNDGVLTTSCILGQDAAAARLDLEEDLR